MLYPVPRTCTFNLDGSCPESHGVAFFREFAAYILLGDPGSGKTTVFKQEAIDSNGLYLSARDFLTFNREAEWQGRTLFIDGLDETRAGKDDPRTPLDAIRGKLGQLGSPRFRLSCRVADWLGGNDETALNACAPEGNIKVLHLNALTDDDIKTILEKDNRVDNGDDFIQKARQFDLQGLLSNPQTLEMLIAAVQGNTWPNTKLETYELACHKMLEEHSDEHRASCKKTLIQTEPLLDAAGFLSATFLLANASAFSENDDISEGLVYLNAITIPDELPCEQVLKSRLFNCTDGQLYTSVHRSVAEFLGARFLGKKIKEGLPFGRILALMTGFDNGVVAALRGLMSWLGAHSPDVRDNVIDIDPSGMVLYGDVQLFSTQTKKQLLSALRYEAKSNASFHCNYYGSGHLFSALITQDMTGQLLDLLISPSREQYDQKILNGILAGVRYSSECVPELKDALLSIVRDKTYWEVIRMSALQAFMHQFPLDVESLFSLAEGFRLNKIEDINNRLLNRLLTKLFPKTINVNRIFDYLIPSTVSPNNYFTADLFWDTDFPEKVVDQDLPILLDELTRREIRFFHQASGYNLSGMIGTLLVRGLLNFGETISDDRLCDWLSPGLDEDQYPSLEEEHEKKIRAWLEDNPERYIGVMSEGMSRITVSENMNSEIYGVFARTYEAAPPDNLGLWWLDFALKADTRVKNECFREAWWLLIRERGHKGLSLEFFKNWIEKYPEFKEMYQTLIVCDIEKRLENAQSKKKWAFRQEEEKTARLTYIRENLTTIQDGSVHPQVLHYLASAYFYHSSNIRGESGSERLGNFLDHNENLINAVKEGLRKVLGRPDLPKNSEIFSIATEPRTHYIHLPFLAAMNELYQERPDALNTLSEALATKALAFWYTYGAGTEPAWVRQLNFSRPVMAANILIEYVSAMLVAKQQYIQGVYQLAHDPEYHEIAKLAAIPLLKVYPVRANRRQASTLECLLKAAIRYGDKDRLLALMTEKLKLKSLDIAQHVYWLASGLFIDPTRYESMARCYVNNNVTRINYLSAFLYNNIDSWEPTPLPLNIIGLIVELLAPRSVLNGANRSDRAVTHTTQEGSYVHSLIKRLSENSDEKSTQVLEHLHSLPQLSAWHEILRSAKQTQQINRREALFQYASAAAVALTLNNLKPANVADLAALTMDHLSRLSEEVRTSNTDNYKRFWNEDSYARPESPKTENSCRDYLLEKLRTLLSPLEVDVQPETHEANDKRADIGLSCYSNGSIFHLRIEIKLDHSKDLWWAIHEQLIPFYTLDPKTQGRGIFLMVWFGEKMMPAPPSGKKPKTATELETRLTETLTTEEKKLISVFVLDVSKPDSF